MRIILLLLLSLFLFQCSENPAPEEAELQELPEHIFILDEIPDHIQEVENLTVYPGDLEPRYSIDLIPVQTFGEEGEPYLTQVSKSVVDDNGRVIIQNISSNYEHSLYVYDADGTYHTQMGAPGRGPGEYGFIFDMHVRSGKVIIRDVTNQRLNIYNTIDYSYERAMLIEQLAINDDKAVEGLSLGLIMPRNDGNYLVSFSKSGFGEEYKYLLMDANGDREDYNTLLFPGSASVKSSDNQMSPSLGLGQVMGTHLETQSNDDSLYSIWTRDFLIKRYDQNGIYQSAIYYPVKGLPFDLEWYDVASPFGYSASEVEKAIKNSDLELPETLPVLSRIMVDDENRIWAAVRMDSIRDMVEWWILDESGELLAKMQRPREKTIFDVKNGYLFAKEIDEETDAEFVVKYRIELDEK